MGAEDVGRGGNPICVMADVAADFPGDWHDGLSAGLNDAIAFDDDRRQVVGILPAVVFDRRDGDADGGVIITAGRAAHVSGQRAAGEPDVRRRGCSEQCR